MHSITGTTFTFIGCAELREILGVKAEDEVQLLDLLEEVPIDSIYYHTHEYFLRHQYLMGLYPNDFATWAAIQVRDRVLGERLGVIDPYEFETLEDLREALIGVVEDHLSKMHSVPRADNGESFYFMLSRLIEVPTGTIACTLRELRDGIASVDASALYFHFYAARIRHDRRDSDFTIWAEEGLRIPALAQQLRTINPYIFSLEELRRCLIGMCDTFLNGGEESDGGSP